MLPLCPIHAHALIGRVIDGQVVWVCPQGAWRCPLGDYEEQTWPPALDAGDMAATFAARLGRRGITGWRELGFSSREGRVGREVGLWPMDEDVMERISLAAAPIRAEFHPEDRVMDRC